MSNGGNCAICGTERKWFPPGVSRRTGEPYEGFWGCPNKKNHPPSTQQAGAFPQVPMPGPPQNPQTAPRPAQMPPMTRSATDLSIEAQACAKAACEAAAGAATLFVAIPNGDQQLENWTVRLAQRLLWEVVRASSRPVPSARPTPMNPPVGREVQPTWEELQSDDPDINF